MPFLLGYIDSNILGFGLAGIVDSLILIVIVRLLNRADPVLRKRIGYIVLGIWLGFAVGFFGVTLLFIHQITAAIGDLASVAFVLIVLPLAGGVVYIGSNDGNVYALGASPTSSNTLFIIIGVVVAVVIVATVVVLMLRKRLKTTPKSPPQQ